MAVNKELKEYLKDCEHKEWLELSARINAKIAENKKNAMSVPEVEEMYALFATAQNALTTLKENHGVKFNSYVESIVQGTFDLLNYIPKGYIDEGVEELRAERENIKSKYSMLLLRLSLEKNFDTINQILIEAGIGFKN